MSKMSRTTINCLEGLGFKVIVVTCDGAKSNRNFFQMHQATESRIPGTKIAYKSMNPFAKGKHLVSLFLGCAASDENS